MRNHSLFDEEVDGVEAAVLLPLLESPAGLLSGEDAADLPSAEGSVALAGAFEPPLPA